MAAEDRTDLKARFEIGDIITEDAKIADDDAGKDMADLMKFV